MFIIVFTKTNFHKTWYENRRTILPRSYCFIPCFNEINKAVMHTFHII